MSYKDFEDLDILYGDDLDTYLMSQVVARFNDASERDEAIPSPEIGQTVFVTGLGHLAYNGTYWAPLPGTLVAKLRRTSATTIASGGVVLWNVEDLDTWGGHSLISNTGRYTVPFSGHYDVQAVLKHGVVAGGTTLIGQLKLNGTNTGPAHAVDAPGSPTVGGTLVVAETLVNLSAGDYIDVTFTNSADSDINASGSMVTIRYAGW